MNEIRTEQGHIPSLNLLRGLAALSVCCFHFFIGTTFENFPFMHAIFSKGYLGLRLFFVISGFVIPYAMYMNNYSFKKLPKFLLKRAIRIEIPYVISFCLIVTMMYIHQHIHKWGFSMDWNRFWLHFVYLNQYFGHENYTSVYWTLAIEFQFYLLIGIVFPLLIASNRIFPFLTLAVFGSLCWFLVLHYNWFIFQYGFMFIAGILVFLYKVDRISMKELISAILLIAVIAYFKNGWDDTSIILLGSTAILAIKREWKVSNFFGRISYSFYLTHLEASGWLTVYFSQYVTNYYLWVSITFTFTILFATGFYYLFERPALRLSKKVSYK